MERVGRETQHATWGELPPRVLPRPQGRLARRRGFALAWVASALLSLAGCGGRPANDDANLPIEARNCVFVSHILFGSGKDGPGLARRRADAALHLIRQGTPFAEVAKSQSEDPGTKHSGGFLGAWYSGRDQNEILDGVMQVLEPGRTVGPVLTPRGWHVLHRHPYEEGRRLERELLFPVWSVTVAWRDLPDGPDRSKEEAEALARKLVDDLNTGAIALPAARAQYDAWKDTRDDGYVGVLGRNERTLGLIDMLTKVPEGRWTGPLSAPQGFVVARRTPLLRCVVRHVLVQHIGARDTDLSMTRLVPEAERLAQEALDKVLKDRSQWDEVVKRYSDEHLTRMDAGSLGCVGPQELPAPVEDALLATKPGAIHPKVIHSERGFHVVWRVD
jgi:hypothetical protein